MMKTNKILNKIVNYIIQKECKICNKRINENEPLCKNCRNDLAWFKKQRKCLKCGNIITINSPEICQDCIENPPYFDFASSIYLYDKNFKTALLDFKFHGGFYRAKIFAKIMKDKFVKLGFTVDYMIPVPMRYHKMIKRGYNPPLEIGYLFKMPILPAALIKAKETSQQSTLKRNERLQNIKGAFSVNKRYINKIKNKNILLIDDVKTTGATVSECAKILKEAGAAHVYVITLLTSSI